MGLDNGQRIDIYEVLKVDPQWKGFLCRHGQPPNIGSHKPGLRFTTNDIGTYCCWNINIEFGDGKNIAFKKVGTIVVKCFHKFNKREVCENCGRKSLLKKKY